MHTFPPVPLPSTLISLSVCSVNCMSQTIFLCSRLHVKVSLRHCVLIFKLVV